MSDTTDMEKLRILTMWECGKSTTEIAKSVNKSVRTVQRWLALQKREGNMQKKPRGLRPRKTTPEEDARILQVVRENPDLTQKEILTICNLNIYKGTLRRRIQEANGIFKIDLFPKSKSVRTAKKRDRRKKKPMGETNELPSSTVETSLKTERTELHQPLESVEEISDENVNPTKSLLETLLNPQFIEIENPGVSYEEEEEASFNDDPFDETSYEMNVTAHDEENLFAATSDYEEFVTPENNVKVEILDVNYEEADEIFEEGASRGETNEELTEETLVDKQAMDIDEVPMEENVIARKKRGRKHRHEVIPDSDARDPLASEETAQEKTPTAPRIGTKTRKRRVKTEVSYVEEYREGENYDGDGRRTEEKTKKQRQKRKSSERKAELKRERKVKRLQKEKLQWEMDRKDTTDIEKKKILIMAECGMSTEDIARALKKSRRTVQRWISKHAKGLDMDKKERGRRPRKTTPEEDARIIQLVKENPHLSRKEILSMANINLHKITLKNRLNEAGLYYNSQGVKILDYSMHPNSCNTNLGAQAQTNHKTERVENSDIEQHDFHEDHEEEEEATTIITCTSLTPTPTITNAILSCPTRSTTLIITNPPSNEGGSPDQSATDSGLPNYTLY